MPSRYYFRPLSRGRDRLGAGIASGIERGVQNFEQTRSTRRAERRQDVDDERRRGFEDSAEERAQEIHPYNLEGLRVGLDADRMGLEADRTNMALTGRQMGGGRYTEGMELPEGTQRYGGIYGLTPEAERTQNLERMGPALSLLSRGLGRDITPEMAAGAAQIGIDPLTLADPRGDFDHDRRIEMLDREIEATNTRASRSEAAALSRAQFQEGAANRRQRERMVGQVILDAYGEFDDEGNWTGKYVASPDEVDEAARRYLETGESPRPMQRAPGAETMEIPGGRLQPEHVEEAVTFLYEDMAGKSRKDMVRELKSQKFTDEEIDFILDALYDRIDPTGPPGAARSSTPARRGPGGVM